MLSCVLLFQSPRQCFASLISLLVSQETTIKFLWILLSYPTVQVPIFRTDFGVSGVMVLQAFSYHGIHRMEHDDMFLYCNFSIVSYEISLSTSMAFIYPWRVLWSVSPMPGTGRIARGMLHGHLLDPLLPYFIFHICRVSGSCWLGPDPRQPYSRRNANTDPELSEVINLYLPRPRQRWNGSLALVSR